MGAIIEQEWTTRRIDIKSNHGKGSLTGMGKMTGIALNNFLVFAIAVILIMYILCFFIKRSVEKDDTLKEKERNKGGCYYI